MSVSRKIFVGWLVVVGLFVATEVATAQRMVRPGGSYWGVNRQWAWGYRQRQQGWGGVGYRCRWGRGCGW